MIQDNQQIFSLPNSGQSPSSTAKKVLLAEDDASVRRFLEVVLRRAGYEVLTAEDGASAMQKALENAFDIVILDAVMPNMSGYEISRILRTHPSFKDIPLVILSGLETEINSDADAYLLKTANLQDELLSVINRLLNEKV